MGYKLFLDDFRLPIDCATYMHQRIGKRNPVYLEVDWILCKNYDEFVTAIKMMGLPDIISFDHDLAMEHYSLSKNREEWDEYHNSEFREMTGYDCAKYLVEWCMNNNTSLPEFFVHSANLVGVENITSLLTNFKKHQVNI